MRTLPPLLAVLVATTALSGCVSYGSGSYGGPPPYYDGREWAWFGAAIGAWVAMAVLVAVLVLAVVAIVLVALSLTAVTARGPAAQAAGVLLAAIGAVWLLAALAEFSPLGVLFGGALLALGVAALVQQAPGAAGKERTAVIEDAPR